MPTKPSCSCSHSLFRIVAVSDRGSQLIMHAPSIHHSTCMPSHVQGRYLSVQFPDKPVNSKRCSFRDKRCSLGHFEIFPKVSFAEHVSDQPFAGNPSVPRESHKLWCSCYLLIILLCTLFATLRLLGPLCRRPPRCTTSQPTGRERARKRGQERAEDETGADDLRSTADSE